MPGSPNKPTTLPNKGFVECVIMQLLGYMAFGMTMPVLPMHIVQMHGSPAAAGAITGMFALCALVLRPLSGYIADRNNKLHLQTLGFVVCGLGSLGYAISPNLALLVVFRIIHSVGFCLQSTVTIAVLMTMIPQGREGEGVGYFSLAQVVSTAAAPLLGVLVANAVGCQATFLIDAACVFAGAVVSSRIPYVHVPAEQPRKLSFASFVSTKSIPLALVAALFAVCSGITSSFIVLLGDSRGIAGSAVFFTVSAILMFFTRPQAGKIIDKRGVALVLYPAFVFEAITMILIATAHSIWAIVVAGALRAFGQGMAQPAVQTQIMLEEGPERSGVASSTFNLGLDLGQGVGAIMGGALAASFGYGACFAACPLGLALAALIFAASRSRARS